MKHLILFVCFLSFILFLSQTTSAVEVSYNISLLVGGGNQYGEGLPADKVYLYNPTAMVFNSKGDLYIVDTQLSVIRKISNDGSVSSTIAGMIGDSGYNGDNIQATKAKLNYPQGIAVNENDEIFISDSGNFRIRKVSNNGIITTVAGNGENGFEDNSQADKAKLSSPNYLLYTNNSLFINDQSNNKIRKLDFTTNSLTTVETYPLGTSSTNNNVHYFANFKGAITKVDSNSGNSTKIGKEIANLSSFILYSRQLDSFFYSIASNHKVYQQSISGNVSTFAGSSNPNSASSSNIGDGNLAENATLLYPYGILIRDGYLYIATQAQSRIRRVDLISGIISTFAGVDPNNVFEGVFGNATYLADSYFRTMVFENEGFVYFSELNKIKVIDKRTSLVRTVVRTSETVDCFTYFNNTLYLVMNRLTVYRVDSNNNSQLVHIAGSLGTIPQERPALGLQFLPKGMAFNQVTGDLFVTDANQHFVSKITKNGILSIIAGIANNPGFNGDNQLAINSQLYTPQSVAINSLNGEIFIVETATQRIRKIDSNGIITTLIISSNPKFIEIMPSTNEIYLAYGCRIAKFSALNGTVIKILAGNSACGFNGDNIPAVNAQISIDGMSVNLSNGDVYFISEGSRIRKIDSQTGIISTIAGTGTTGYNGDSIAAVSSQINNPAGIAIHPTSGEVFISDSSNFRIRKIDSKGIISTIAGTGTLGHNGENIPATSAQLYYPSSLAFLNEELYFAAYDRIRKISNENLVSTVAGGDGDGGKAQFSNLETVQSITMSNVGEMYLSTGNRIRKISNNGIISTIAGMIYNFGYNGDRKLATTAYLWNPIGISVNSEGEVFIADMSNHRIRKVSKSGTISTIAGLGSSGFIDNVQATESQLNTPKGVVVAPSNEVFIADFGNNRIRKISTSGIISTISGGGTLGLTSEILSATQSKLSEPSSVNLNSNGEVLIFERNAIRKLIPLSISCFGKIDSEACSGNGNCISYDKCSCDTGSKYYGVICEKFDCNGKQMNESDVCSGRGKCLAPNSCSCLEGFSGGNCENSLISPVASRKVVQSEKIIGKEDNTLVIVLAIVLPLLFIIALIIVILVIVAVVYFKRKQKKASSSNYPNKEANIEMGNFSITDFPSEGSLFLQPLMSISSTGKKEEPFNPLSRYSNLEKVGSGSFGNVFKAFDEKTKTTKAIKVIRYSNIDELNNFMREGSQLMNVNHPNILKVNEFFVGQDQMLCIDTNFYEKGDLAQLTNIDFECSEHLLKQILHQACKALDYIHCNMNVIHRDIKPSNIFIQSLENDRIHIIIADFGLAKTNMSSVMHSFAGTPLFMSPELGFGGKYYHNTDIYSLGVTLYQIMTKDNVTSISQLYVSKDQESVIQILRKKMKEAELYSDKVINIVLSMLSKDSVTRPQAQDILNDSYFR